IEHPSAYRFGTDGETIYLGTEDGDAIDLLRRRGQPSVFPFDDMLRSLENFTADAVPAFERPSKHIEIQPARMGGWPTIQGTRVPYDEIARLVDFATIYPEDVSHYYPSVSRAAAEDAVDFASKVEAVAS